MSDLPVAALLVHPDRGIVAANSEAVWMLLGSASTESTTAALDGGLANETVLSIRQLASSARSGPATSTLELVSDGRTRQLRARAKWQIDAGVGLVTLEELPDLSDIQHALEHSERLYDTFLQQSPAGILHLDADGNVTFENDQARSLFDAAGGSSWIGRRAHEADSLDESARERIRDLIAKGENFKMHRVRIAATDGMFRMVVLQGTAVHHPDGSRVGSILMLLDQTDVVLQDQSIQLRNRFRTAEANIRRAASVESDEQSFLNGAARTMAEAVGAEHLGIVVSSPHDDAFRVRAQWPQSGDAGALAAGGGDEDPLLEANRDGVFWTPFLVGDDVGGFVAYFDHRPLTQHERTSLLEHMDGLVRVFERQWRTVQLGYRYRLAVNSIEDGLFNYVLDPTGERRYLFATDQFEGLFGHHPRDIIRPDAPAAWFSAGLDDAGLKAMENHHAALSAGVASRTVFRFVSPDGRVRWLREDASPQREASGRLTVTGIVVDVTEQKEAEEMLDRARRAAEAEARRKTAFIATMSHELRTPLGTVHGFADLLRRELDELPPDAPLAGLAEFATAIEERSGELLTVVEDLLDLSNLESGLLALSRLPVDLEAVVHSVVSRSTSAAEAKGLRLHVDAAHDGSARVSAPVSATGDALRVERILDRIMSNAIKFTPSGLIRVSVGSDDSHGFIQIADEGVGMSEEQLQRVFEPFVQGDDRLNRSYEGAGLGMTVAKRLAVAMGGDLEASSTPDVGTTVVLRLPLVASPGAAAD